MITTPAIILRVIDLQEVMLLLSIGYNISLSVRHHKI